MATSNPGVLPLTDANLPNTITLDNITQITTRNISSLQGAIISPANEIMNFPAVESANDAQPEWWEEDAAEATLTEVDTAGETITETYDRCLKVVVSADTHWAYQRLTYADQQRVKSGAVASFWCAVWSVSSASARIGLATSTPTTSYSTPTTSAAWNLHRVDSLTLDGTYVDLICEVTAGTAYFVPLGMVIGASPPTTALAMQPRGLVYRYVTAAVVLDVAAAADPDAWTDVDVTANSSPLAVMAIISLVLLEATSEYKIFVRREGSAEADDDTTVIADVQAGQPYGITQFQVVLNDLQIFEYLLDRLSGTNALDAGKFLINGYWEWA